MPRARLGGFTAGGFGAGAAALVGGDCYRRYIPYDNEGA